MVGLRPPTPLTLLFWLNVFRTKVTFLIYLHALCMCLFFSSFFTWINFTMKPLLFSSSLEKIETFVPQWLKGSVEYGAGSGQTLLFCKEPEPNPDCNTVCIKRLHQAQNIQCRPLPWSRGDKSLANAYYLDCSDVLQMSTMNKSERFLIDEMRHFLPHVAQCAKQVHLLPVLLTASDTMCLFTVVLARQRSTANISTSEQSFVGQAAN